MPNGLKLKVANKDKKFKSIFTFVIKQKFISIVNLFIRYIGFLCVADYVNNAISYFKEYYEFKPKCS